MTKLDAVVSMAQTMIRFQYADHQGEVGSYNIRRAVDRICILVDGVVDHQLARDAAREINRRMGKRRNVA